MKPQILHETKPKSENLLLKMLHARGILRPPAPAATKEAAPPPPAPLDDGRGAIAGRLWLFDGNATKEAGQCNPILREILKRRQQQRQRGEW